MAWRLDQSLGCFRMGTGIFASSRPANRFPTRAADQIWLVWRPYPACGKYDLGILDEEALDWRSSWEGPSLNHFVPDL